MTETIRLAELTSAVARAADAGIGFPPETSLRLCVIAVALARAVGLSDEETRDVYHAALLRHAGCTASAHEETRIVQDMYAAFGRGDIGFVLEQIDDACDGFCVVSASQTGVPWHVGAATRGKAGAVAYFEALASSVDHKLFEQGDFAAGGDHVYATVRLVQYIRATGKTLEQPEVVHHWTFKNGKVVRCRVLEDTAATKAAFAA